MITLLTVLSNINNVSIDYTMIQTYYRILCSDKRCHLYILITGRSKTYSYDKCMWICSVAFHKKTWAMKQHMEKRNLNQHTTRKCDKLTFKALKKLNAKGTINRSSL